jgi:GTP-binding protein
VRRRGRVSETVEKFSIVKTLQAIEDSHVVILVVDAQEGLVEQDLHLMGTVVDSGRALVVAVNKWDHLEPEVREKIRETLRRRLNFIPWAKIHYISALHGPEWAICMARFVRPTMLPSPNSQPTY